MGPGIFPVTCCKHGICCISSKLPADNGALKYNGGSSDFCFSSSQSHWKGYAVFFPNNWTSGPAGLGQPLPRLSEHRHAPPHCANASALSRGHGGKAEGSGMSSIQCLETKLLVFLCSYPDSWIPTTWPTWLIIRQIQKHLIVTHIRLFWHTSVTIAIWIKRQGCKLSIIFLSHVCTVPNTRGWTTPEENEELPAVAGSHEVPCCCLAKTQML